MGETQGEPSAKKEYTLEEIGKHTTEESCWLIIGNASNGGPKVYDVTKYLDDHPGGAEVLLDVSGQDADEFFEDIGHSREAREELKKLYVGELYMDEETKEKLILQAEAKKNQKNSQSAQFLAIVFVILAVLVGYYYQLEGGKAETEA